MGERGSFGSFLQGMIIGGAIGAVIAMLNTPRTGDETRVMLRERGMELRDRARTTFEETRTQAEQALSEARDRAATVASQKLEQASEVLDRSAQKISETGQGEEIAGGIDRSI